MKKIILDAGLLPTLNYWHNPMILLIHFRAQREKDI